MSASQSSSESSADSDEERLDVWFHKFYYTIHLMIGVIYDDELNMVQSYAALYALFDRFETITPNIYTYDGETREMVEKLDTMMDKAGKDYPVEDSFARIKTCITDIYHENKLAIGDSVENAVGRARGTKRAKRS